MLKHYLILSIKVLLRRKFFTFISVFGVSFTLLVLMVAVAMLDHMFGPGAPEPRLERTLEVMSVTMTGPNERSRGSGGFQLFDRYARELPGVERLSIATNDEATDSYVNGQKITSMLKRTDGEFWAILDFAFLEGAPYSSEDVKEARFVAVINHTTRARFFGDGAALGKTIETGGQRFRVVGVVEDVSRMRRFPFADVWVPYTTYSSDQYRQGLMGEFTAVALGKSKADLPLIREEFNARLERVEFETRDFDRIVAPFETKFGGFARQSVGDSEDPNSQAWKLAIFLATVALLFIVLPTVNLVNLNLSRIIERASEIGVRKAFGASSRTLVGQFVVENVLLTLVGGGVGLLLSVGVLRALNESGIAQYSQFAVNLRVFIYGLLLAVAFGIVSGVYPAWRMSRLHPATALRGGERR